MQQRKVTIYAALAIVAITSSILLPKNIDFAPYWYGVRGFLDGSKPLYGPQSGIGYPQEFRYPPVTVLFFAPWTRIPMRIAGILFDLLAWAACVWAAICAIRGWKLAFTGRAVLLAAILAGPYIYLALKFGNVQPILTALVLVALVWGEDRPVWSGTALAIAICFKVWPLYFVLWFLIPGRRRALVSAAAASAVLWTAPILYFGFDRYLSLLRDFYTHAASLASNPEQLWYASQSLRGVLLRFFTNSVAIPPDYPNPSVAALPVDLCVGIWIAAGALATGYAVISLWRARSRYIWDALGFLLCAALQPFSFNSTLILLGPAILAGAHLHSSRFRWSFAVAAALSGVGALMFTRALVHLNLMLGLHFWIMLALGYTLVSAARETATTS